MRTFPAIDAAFLGALLLFALAMAPCAMAEASPANHETITAVVVRDFPPQYSVDEQNRPTGFAIDMIEEVARVAGLDIRYMLFDGWPQANIAFNNGLGDIIPNARILPARDSLPYLYSSPMETFDVAAFRRSSSALLTDTAQMEHLSVVVCQDNIGQEIMQDHPDGLLHVVSSPREALFMLLSGEADIMVYPAPTLKRILQDTGLEDRVKRFGAPLLEIKRGIMIRNTRPELAARLDQALQTVLASPAYQDIYERWYGTYQQHFWTPMRVLAFALEIIVFMAVLAFVWRFLSLRKLNARLRELRDLSEKKFDITFEKANIGMAHVGLDGTWIDVNGRLASFFGYSRQELQGMTFQDLTYPDDLPLDLELLQETITGKRPGYKMEKRYITKSGEVVWANLSVSLVRSRDGLPKFFISIIEDLSFRKEQEQQDRTNAILNAVSNSLTAVYVYSLTLNTNVYINPRYTAILGYSLQELQDMDPEAFATLFHPDDRNDILEHMNALRRSKPGDAFEIRYRFRHKKGHWIWCHSRDSLLEFDAAGNPLSFIGSFLDVSESMRTELALRNSLARMQAVFDNSGLGIKIMTLDGHVLEHNNQLARMLGYAPEEFSFSHAGDHTHPDDLDEQSAHYARLAAGRISTFSMKKRYRRKDGSWLWVMLYVTTTVEGGNETLAVGIVKDINTEVELEESQARQEQLLIQQSKLASMGEMIGAIAHQWRQPLSAIGGALINIEESFEYGDISRDYLRTLVDGAERNLRFMSRTIDDFRNFFAPSKNTMPFSVQQAILESINIVSAQIRDREITLHFEEQPGNWSTFGYPGEFKQVLINLIGNARDAIVQRIDSGGLARDKGHIILSLEHGKDAIITRVQDNGGGVPEDVMERIFEPYFTTREPGQGTGIGLYMSKIIIENNMNGRLQVHNQDSGAVFTISLPREHDD